MIRVIKGDITKVTGFQAIVNSANNSLLGGGGVDGQIHRAAGPQLRTECRKLNGCETGESRITLGYNLPCNYIIHSVGPVWMGGTAGEEDLLRSCYFSALSLALDNNIRKIAFSAISSGEYGYPAELSSKIAVAAVMDFIKDNPNSFDDICWVVTDDNTASVFAAEIKAAAPKKAEPKKKKTTKKAEAAEETDTDADGEAETDLDASGESLATASTKDSDGDEENAEAVETSPKEGEAAAGKFEESENAADSKDSGTTKDSTGNTKEKNSYSSDEANTSDVKGVNSADVMEEADDSGKDNNATEDSKVDESSENIVEDAEKSTIESSKTSTSDTIGNFNGAIWNRYDIRWLIKDSDKGVQHTYTCFWHSNENSENSILSTWYGGKLIFINGRKYDTVEQYIMSEMALLFGDMGTYQLIMAEPDPGQCKKYARNIQHFDEAAWSMIFKEVIFHGNVGKAVSDKEFARALLATGDSVLIEASPFDDIYGAGMKESELLDEDGTLKVPPRLWRAYKSDRQAQNALGFVLMAVRDYLRMFMD